MSQRVTQTPFLGSGGLEKEAEQQEIPLILKFVRKRFHPNLSQISLILLIRGKTVKLSICSGNQFNGKKMSTFEC